MVRAERVVAVTNDVFAESGKHYITLFVLCWRVSEDQEPQVGILLRNFVPALTQASIALRLCFSFSFLFLSRFIRNVTRLDSS